MVDSLGYTRKGYRSSVYAAAPDGDEGRIMMMMMMMMMIMTTMNGLIGYIDRVYTKGVSKCCHLLPLATERDTAVGTI